MTGRFDARNRGRAKQREAEYAFDRSEELV
jgi:hypothetical protein